MLAPAWVVQVLLAPGGVDPRRLQMPQRVRANPHVRPGRRDREAPHALEHLAVAHGRSLLVDVRKSPPPSSSLQTGLRAVRSPKPAPTLSGCHPWSLDAQRCDRRSGAACSAAPRASPPALDEAPHLVSCVLGVRAHTLGAALERAARV